MRSRYQDGQTQPLELENILEETGQLDIGLPLKHWLIEEALPLTTVLEEIDGKWRYKTNLQLRESFVRNSE